MAEIFDRMNVAGVIYELEEMRRDRDRMAASKRQCDARLGREQTLGLNRHVWQPTLQLVGRPSRLGIGPAADNPQLRPDRVGLSRIRRS